MAGRAARRRRSQAAVGSHALLDRAVSRPPSSIYDYASSLRAAARRGGATLGGASGRRAGQGRRGAAQDGRPPSARRGSPIGDGAADDAALAAGRAKSRRRALDGASTASTASAFLRAGMLVLCAQAGDYAAAELLERLQQRVHFRAARCRRRRATTTTAAATRRHTTTKRGAAPPCTASAAPRAPSSNAASAPLTSRRPRSRRSRIPRAAHPCARRPRRRRRRVPRLRGALRPRRLCPTRRLAAGRPPTPRRRPPAGGPLGARRRRRRRAALLRRAAACATAPRPRRSAAPRARRRPPREADGALDTLANTLGDWLEGARSLTADDSAHWRRRGDAGGRRADYRRRRRRGARRRTTSPSLAFETSYFSRQISLTLTKRALARARLRTTPTSRGHRKATSRPLLYTTLETRSGPGRARRRPARSAPQGCLFCFDVRLVRGGLVERKVVPSAGQPLPGAQRGGPAARRLQPAPATSRQAVASIRKKA